MTSCSWSDDSLGLHGGEFRLGGGEPLWIQSVVVGGDWAGSNGLNQMLHHVLDRWKLFAGSHHGLILHKKLLGHPYVPAGRQLP